MKETLEAINRMRADGVISRYVFDSGKLDSVLSRHGLSEKWEKFRRKFIGDKP